jgi:hypothetical protein
LGQYAFAGQYQQSPQPRKGGIFKREYWQPYIPPTTGSRKGMWPDFDFVCVSVDSAFTEKEENDPTGCTTWGIWTDPADGYPKVMLVMAWADPRRGEPQETGESEAERQPRSLRRRTSQLCCPNTTASQQARSEAAGAFGGRGRPRLRAFEFTVKVMVFADVVTVPDVGDAVSQVGVVIE